MALALSCTKAQFDPNPADNGGSGGTDGVALPDGGQDDGEPIMTDSGADDAADDEILDALEADDAPDADFLDGRLDGRPPVDTAIVQDAADLGSNPDAVGEVGGTDRPSIEGGPPAEPPTAAGQIVVTEVMNDPNVVADAFGEWFELYNPDESVTFDLGGCEISDTVNHHTISRSLPIPPKAFRTLAIHGKRTVTSPFGVVFEPDYVYAGVKFGNTHADGVHVTCQGTVIATFDYDTPDLSMSGHSFSVDPAHYRNGDNQLAGHWCRATVAYDSDPGATVVDYGTPGKPNPPCP